MLVKLFRAYAIADIPARTRQGAAIIHMILNNLDPAVAQFPQELVTYGGNGQVFSNWAQVCDSDCKKRGNVFKLLFTKKICLLWLLN
jgi:urocanate hydratase